MKSGRLFTRTCCLLGLLLSTACGSRTEKASPDYPEFKMIVRLWPDHHKDSALREELLQALKKYPDFCDEVWLCMEFETFSKEAHKESARAMAVAAERLRNAGMGVLNQGITLGHGDDFESGAARPTRSSHGAISSTRGMSGPSLRAVPASRLSTTTSEKSMPCTPGYAGRPAYGWTTTCASRITLRRGSSVLRYLPQPVQPAARGALDPGNAGRGAGQERRGRPAAAAMDIVLPAEPRRGSRTVARAVHEVSPGTRMGLQHANFHRELMEGRDWNPTLDALEEETGLAPASRPGNGFYDDHAPRGMLLKGYDMARQIRRLKPSVREIAAEVEGYRHRATGKSPHGLCVESMFYLAMGATQLSYAIICAPLRSRCSGMRTTISSRSERLAPRSTSNTSPSTEGRNRAESILISVPTMRCAIRRRANPLSHGALRDPAI